MVRQISAIDMARSAGVDPKRFRQALRDADFAWHMENANWLVYESSPEHQQMAEVLDALKVGHLRSKASKQTSPPRGGRTTSDEAYILELCDQFFGCPSIRQHRFEFLRGDPNSAGKSAKLPVDAWYPDFNLVVEYRERQHSEAVTFFDKRSTVSGVGRGTQRAIYDQRRREVLNAQSISLIEFDFSEFSHQSNKRLKRTPSDWQVVAHKLSNFSKAP